MTTAMTRRGLITSATMVAAMADTASAPAQSTPAQPDLAKATREQNQRAGDVLAKFEIPLGTEPAFQFKA